MEMVLSGCPNLEFLKLDSFFGLHYLEIRSPKLETLIIKNHYTNEDDPRMEVVTPHVQCLQLLGSSHERLVWLTNVASVVTMLVDNECFRWDDNDKVDKECKYLKEVLHSLVHAKNLELGRWCIELLSVLVLDGWQAPASSRRSLTLKAGLVQQHFPAICSLLQSSPDLETFIIDMSWQSVGDLLSRLINEDENGKKFEKHIFDCSLLHLRTIKITNFYVPLRSNKFMMPLVKYLLKNAEVLEKMVITARLCHNKVQEDDVPLSFVEMAQEFLSFPRSSKHAAVVFSYS